MFTSPVIAIVDDDETVRDALFDLLQVEGLQASTFPDAATFLAAKTDDFACVITDVRMPDIDGLNLQQRLRAQGSAMAVIFITASVNDATRSRALSDGAFAWFTKPVPNDQLLITVRRALGERRGTLQ